MAKTVRFDGTRAAPPPVAPVAGAARAVQSQRRALPMYRARRAVVRAVLAQRVTVVVGETGSGKSTQLPQALLAADPTQRIVVSQPRRVAAISLAQRVAREADCAVGTLVGYSVRFDARVSAATRVRYVTDGMLLREFMLSPTLAPYTTVVVDEAHERTLTSDLVLGLLKRALAARRDLRVVVMSATLDAELFARFFGAPKPLYVPGRAFRVERFYARAPVANIVDASVRAVQQINAGEPSGDILVFLPGQDEIEAARDLLAEYRPPPGAPALSVLPLYAALPERQQQAVFEPARGRKVVLATNIAETSVTISGVRYVVDSGVRKVRVHRTALGLESLLPGPISQASAAQRAGRAGRERDGKVWRLYTENTYLHEMQAQTEPEIARVALAHAVLVLKRVGADAMHFDWLTPPGKVAVRNALLQLLALGALDAHGLITPFGRRMAALPLDPALAAVLLTAFAQPSRRVRAAVLDVAACLSVPDLLLAPSAARRQEVNDARHALFPAAQRYGDLALLKLVYDAARRVPRAELREWCHAVGVNHRGLQRVAQVRKQLLQYIKGRGQKRRGSAGAVSADHTAGADGADDMSDASDARDISVSELSELSDASDASDTSDTGDAGNTSGAPGRARSARRGLRALSDEEHEALIKVFLQGYVTNTAIALPDRRYQTTLTQQPVSIHPGSALYGQHPEAIVYLEYVYTARGYARLVAPVAVEWLKATAPELLARAGG